jgi:hypothetical protein
MEAAVPNDGDAAEIAARLLSVCDVKEIGPAVFLDIARYIEQRRAVGNVDEGDLVFESFYSYLLPQFEGIDDEGGRDLFRAVGRLLSPQLRERLRKTLNTVLGLELIVPAPRAAAIEAVEDDDADALVDEADPSDDGAA